MALFCVCFGLVNDMMTPIKVNIFSVISQVCVPIVILAYMVNVFLAVDILMELRFALPFSNV